MEATTERSLVDDLRTRVSELERELNEREASFNLQWDVSRRATDLWQELHPGSELIWPDSAKLMVFLMELVTAQAETTAALEQAIDHLLVVKFDPDKPMPREMLAALMNLTMVAKGLELAEKATAAAGNVLSE